jgi:hypothetical protein
MATFSLSTVLPAALLWATQAGAITFPATVEVDLIFPRNDTYAPSAMFPIVFAFQNAALVPSLDPEFDINIFDSTGNHSIADEPDIDLKWANFSGNDPMYVYTYVTGLNTTEGLASASHALLWGFGAGNCSDNDGGLKFGGGFQGGSVVFTIQSGAQQPNLVAGPASNSHCANISHLAFNLTGTLDVAIPAEHDGRNTCAVFSDVNPLVTGNPCAAEVNSATASSISAALTATACAVGRPGVSCNSTNAAAKGWNTGNTMYTAWLGGLVMAFVAMQCL